MMTLEVSLTLMIDFLINLERLVVLLRSYLLIFIFDKILRFDDKVKLSREIPNEFQILMPKLLNLRSNSVNF